MANADLGGGPIFASCIHRICQLLLLQERAVTVVDLARPGTGHVRVDGGRAAA